MYFLYTLALTMGDMVQNWVEEQGQETGALTFFSLSHLDILTCGRLFYLFKLNFFLFSPNLLKMISSSIHMCIPHGKAFISNGSLRCYVTVKIKEC